MCGLVAVLNTDGRSVELGLLKRMTDLIHHRGPDDEGHYLAGPLGFGFRRLAILDLSPAGHQPMSLPDAGLTIVFNGEIYNYLELRRELEGLGHQFRSRSDTEVLLHAYQQWGQQCLSRLNGMWAFLIHDRRRNRVFGARDRFGIKPLFRYQDGSQVLFASEIKAIRDSGRMQAGTNWQVAADFLVHGPLTLDSSNATFYDNISQVGAGCAFELGLNGSYREWQYWSLAQIEPRRVADPAGEYAALFEDAVRLHMRSDVPVAVHLSGGLDSSAILCEAARIRAADGARDPMQSFCFMDEAFDERRYIDATLAQAGARMETLQADVQQIWDDLPRLLWHQDEPVHSLSSAVSFQLMKQTAARGVKVVLNGQGADETAAGYPAFFRHYWHSLMRAGHPIRAWNEIAAYVRCHGGSTGAHFRAQLELGLRNALSALPPYRALALQRARAAAINPWLQPEFCRHAQPQLASRDQRLPAALANATTSTPLPLYLRVEDRNSSAHSIEGRVPFLDHRLVELLFQLPDDWHMRGHWNKYVQREALRGRIPESVRTRVDKMGFPVPSRRWMCGALYDMTRDLLGSRAARERGIYNVPALLQKLDRMKADDTEPGMPLFHFVEFELWCQMETPQSNLLPSVAA